MIDHRVPFTTQERYRLRQVGALVGAVDYWRGRRAALERQLGWQPSEIRRELLLKELLDANRREQQAILDLRDASSYLVGLVAPVSEG